MRFLDLIEAKKAGGSLPSASWDAAIAAIVGGEVPDYQITALLMAIRWRGLDEQEAVDLTRAMAGSGDTWIHPEDGPPLVDKHSTGGVGDKVSLVLAPLAAACGCRVPMVSGRGLGHSGGTLDKLESIPGFRTQLSREQFGDQLERLGVAMGAQTEQLVPADRILYALRDATATVDEPGLITASILSKKIAEGTRNLVLDVKVGRGAFLGDLERCRDLARRLVAVACDAGVRTTAVLTDMDQPLGRAVGNAVEVAEAIACLSGAGPPDLRELSIELTGEMLRLGGLAEDADDGRRLAAKRLDSGHALERFTQLVEAQGGDPAVAERPETLPRGSQTTNLYPAGDGFVADLDPLAVGRAAVALRAGRDHREDRVDPGAGVFLHARRGEALDASAPWATMTFEPGADHDRARLLLESALTIGRTAPGPCPLIIERHA
jgi:pyrimidine-nucleoside phosphorylase